MRSICLIIIGIVLSVSASAQGYVFRVMLNKGENSFGTSDKWEKLVTGTRLQADQSVKIADGGYVALVHSSGATLELKEKGEYAVKDLDQKISGGQSSLLQKYTQYIMENISDDDHHRLSATGAVTRSIINVKVYMGIYSEYFGKEQIFDWEDVKDAKGYVVVLKDKFDDEIIKKEVVKSEITIDFSDPKLKNEELVSVFITPKGEAANKDGYGLKPLKNETFLKVKSEYENLSNEINIETPLGHLVAARFFEEQGLTSDAITHHKKAIALAPGVPDYVDFYTQFLERNGLKEREPK